LIPAEKGVVTVVRQQQLDATNTVRAPKAELRRAKL